MSPSPTGSPAPLADFIAIDVETANLNLSSIYQIGLARFRNEEIGDL